MALVSLTELKSNLSKGSSILGLDLGTRTIGLAISDSTCLIASPFQTIRRRKFSDDSQKLIQVIALNDIGGLVVGMPVTMDVTEGERCQSTRQFVTNFQGRKEIDIAFWDERLSTKAVDRFLINEINMSCKRRREVIDKIAAAYILQGALDSLSTS